MKIIPGVGAYVPQAAPWLRNINVHLMFLGSLTWPRNIISYVPRGLGPTEEHKNTSYVPQFADVHQLCTSVFEPRNVFSDMNISHEEHKN
jgi:hypothetical protein